MHRMDPMHKHEKHSPSVVSRYKFTIGTAIGFGIVIGVLFSENSGPGLWWYALACASITLLIFLAEVLRK